MRRIAQQLLSAALLLALAGCGSEGDTGNAFARLGTSSVVLGPECPNGCIDLLGGWATSNCERKMEQPPPTIDLYDYFASQPCGVAENLCVHNPDTGWSVCDRNAGIGIPNTFSVPFDRDMDCCTDVDGLSLVEFFELQQLIGNSP